MLKKHIVMMIVMMKTILSNITQYMIDLCSEPLNNARFFHTNTFKASCNTMKYITPEKIGRILF